MIKMEAPQIIYTAMFFMGWGIIISHLGQPKTGHYNAVDLLMPLVTLGLLWWGGFYGG